MLNYFNNYGLTFSVPASVNGKRNCPGRGWEIPSKWDEMEPEKVYVCYFIAYLITYGTTAVNQCQTKVIWLELTFHFHYVILTSKTIWYHDLLHTIVSINFLFLSVYFFYLIIYLFDLFSSICTTSDVRDKNMPILG